MEAPPLLPMDRVSILRAIVLRKSVVAVSIVFGIVGIWDTIQSQFLWGAWQENTPRASDLVVRFPWWVWIPVGLIALLAAVLEGAYHEIRAKNEQINILRTPPEPDPKIQTALDLLTQKARFFLQSSGDRLSLGLLASEINPEITAELCMAKLVDVQRLEIQNKYHLSDLGVSVVNHLRDGLDPRPRYQVVTVEPVVLDISPMFIESLSKPEKSWLCKARGGMLQGLPYPGGGEPSTTVLERMHRIGMCERVSKDMGMWPWGTPRGFRNYYTLSGLGRKVVAELCD